MRLPSRPPATRRTRELGMKCGEVSFDAFEIVSSERLPTMDRPCALGLEFRALGLNP